MADFGNEVELWIKDSVKSADAVTRKTALDLFSRVIERTPADMGTHRGNWNCSIGSPNESFSETIRDQTPDGGPTAKKVSSALATVKGDVDIYLANSGPAINVLEYGGYPTRGGHGPSNGPKTINGYSRKAPRGMVRVSVAEFEEHFNRAARSEGFIDS